MLQSYARESGLFSLGTSYLILYAPVYGAFMWLELFVAKGLLATLWPSVPEGIWAYVILIPVCYSTWPAAKSPVRCSRFS